MTPDWSRRAGRALARIMLPTAQEKQLVDAVYAADTIGDLPPWAREVILRAETLPEPERLTGEQLAERARVPLDELAAVIGRVPASP